MLITNVKRVIMAIFILQIFMSCSSSKKQLPKGPEERKNDEIQREYVVVDAMSSHRPGWIENAGLWAKSKARKPNDKYFSFETDLIASKSIACSLAKANARADIAAEISTFINKELSSSTEGSALVDENNPSMENLKNFVENTLAEKIQSMLHGTSIELTYWEKRKYKKSLGASRNYAGYTCAVLIKIGHKLLKDSIERASQILVKKTNDPSTKSNVKKALKNISKDFLKARHGEL